MHNKEKREVFSSRRKQHVKNDEAHEIDCLLQPVNVGVDMHKPALRHFHGLMHGGPHTLLSNLDWMCMTSSYRNSKTINIFRFRQVDFFPLHVVHTGSGALTASYPMNTGGSFLGSKATEA